MLGQASRLGADGVTGDFDGDGTPDLAVEHLDTPDSLSVFFGPYSPGVWSESEAAAFRLVATPGGTGSFSYGATDVDGDGQRELLFYSVGDVWEVLDPAPGPSGAIFSSALVVQATIDVSTWDGGYREGMRWSNGADVDLDGVADLWLTTFDGALADPYLKLLPGPITGPRDPLLESIAVYEMEPAVDYPVGRPDLEVHAVGHFDGDGVPDLAFGREEIGLDGEQRGKVAWILNPPLVQAPVDDAITSVVQGAGLGRELSSLSGVVLVPDMDGDGYDETAFSANADYSPGGVAFLQYGPPPVGTFGEECLSVTLAPDVDTLSTYKIQAGDVDGDGTTDLVVTDPFTSTAYNHLFYGPVPTGVWPIGELADALLPGDAVLLGLADFSGDGADDVALGEWQDGAADDGKAYILLGGFE